LGTTLRIFGKKEKGDDEILNRKIKTRSCLISWGLQSWKKSHDRRRIIRLETEISSRIVEIDRS